MEQGHHALKLAGPEPLVVESDIHLALADRIDVVGVPCHIEPSAEHPKAGRMPPFVVQAGERPPGRND